jgi:hypothetical protein
MAPACSTCNRAAAHRCGACHAPYCSRGCQAHDWPTHAARCTSRSTFYDDDDSSDGSSSSSGSDSSSDEDSIGAQMRAPAVSQWKQAVASLIVTISRLSECEIDRQIGEKTGDPGYGLSLKSPLRGFDATNATTVLGFQYAKTDKRMAASARKALERALSAPRGIPLEASIFAGLSATNTYISTMAGTRSVEVSTFSKYVFELLVAREPKERRMVAQKQLFAKMTLVGNHLMALGVGAGSCSADGAFSGLCRPDTPLTCANNHPKKR